MSEMPTKVHPAHDKPKEKEEDPFKTFVYEPKLEENDLINNLSLQTYRQQLQAEETQRLIDKNVIDDPNKEEETPKKKKPPLRKPSKKELEEEDDDLIHTDKPTKEMKVKLKNQLRVLLVIYWTAFGFLVVLGIAWVFYIFSFYAYEPLSISVGILNFYGYLLILETLFIGLFILTIILRFFYGSKEILIGFSKVIFFAYIVHFIFFMPFIIKNSVSIRRNFPRVLFRTMRDGYSKYHENWDVSQELGRCCGSENPSDWDNVTFMSHKDIKKLGLNLKKIGPNDDPKFRPKSCCLDITNESTFGGFCRENSTFTEGCKNREFGVYSRLIDGLVVVQFISCLIVIFMYIAQYKLVMFISKHRSISAFFDKTSQELYVLKDIFHPT